MDPSAEKFKLLRHSSFKIVFLCIYYLMFSKNLLFIWFKV